jgi:hypothetical protein
LTPKGRQLQSYPAFTNHLWTLQKVT